MSLPESAREENELAAMSAAHAVRERHGLGVAPIADVAALLEDDMGFDVLLAPMPVDVDAMVAADFERQRVIIGVATTPNAERQRFSIAHELGHAYFQDLVDGTRTHTAESGEEDRAHCFARHFLIPEKGMALRLGEMKAQAGSLTEIHLSALVQYFGVSAYVAARQLRRSGWIDDSQYQKWKWIEAEHLAALYGWDSERHARVVASTTPRTPQRLARRATQAYSAGLVPLQTLAGIRGDKSLRETRRWLEEVGITVEQAPAAELVAHESDEI